MGTKTWALTTPADDALKSTVPNLIRDAKKHGQVAAGFYAEAQDTPDQTIAIYAGICYFGTTKVEYAGLDVVDLGTGGAFETSALTADYYNKVLFTIDSAGTLAATEGTEAAAVDDVVPPLIPAGKFPICMVTVQDDGTGTAGTILTIEQSEIQQLQGWGQIEELGASNPILNLKPAVNAAVNKLDIFSKSGGAAPDASNPIRIMIPDGTGYTQRTRSASYLSGTGQIVMADAGGYWGRSSLADEIKTAWLYAIWDGTGIVWALGGYSGFTTVPTTTTPTDDDYFLLEDGSTYTRNAAHYCVAVAKIRYEYNTADAPDHTIQAAAVNAPQIIWNPKSDYGYTKSLTTTNTSAGDIAIYSAVSVVVKQPGAYMLSGQTLVNNINGVGSLLIRTGSATYGDATIRGYQIVGNLVAAAGSFPIAIQPISLHLNAGDTIHLGVGCTGPSGNRIVYGDDNYTRATSLTFRRAD